MSDPGGPDFIRRDELSASILDWRDVASEQIGRLAMKAADHGGQLKKLDLIIASVQSSLSAWQNTAIGIAGAIGVIIAALAAFQIASFSEISGLRSDTKSQIDYTNAKIDALANRLQSIEVTQQTLPAQISQQLINTAAALSTVRGASLPTPPAKSPQPAH
jgi:hypothetical protein